MRPVINLKKLNEWVEPQHFKMEGMGTLRELLRVNNWMVKVDLKDAYFTIPIHPTHQPFLKFVVGQKHFQFTCLPFGLSCAPWAFTKVMKPITILLQGMEVHMIVYIDDILVMAESSDLVKSHLEALTDLLTGLGFIINTTKSIITPNSTDRVPGAAGGLHHSTLESTRGEDTPPENGGESESPKTTGDSTTAGTANWKTAGSLTNNPPRSSLLLVSTRRPTESPELQQPRLQHSAVTVTISLGGTDLVAGEACTVEWQSSHSPGTDSHNQVRCFPPGMGGSVQWHQDGRCLEPTRAGYAHQLPGTSGSNPGSEDLLEGSVRNICTPTTGQPDSHILHQQHGGNSLPPTNRPGQGFMDVGSVQQHHTRDNPGNLQNTLI